MKISFKSIFRYYRVKDWRAYLALGAFGFFVARGFLFPLFDIIRFLIILILLLAFGFSVNNFFDTKEDQEKGKTILIKNKKNFLFSVWPGILALLISTSFGLKVFLFVLIASLIGFFYSAPPLRMKSRPFLDLISHGLFAGALIFFFPILAFRSQTTLFHYLVAFSIFYLSVTLEMRNHLEDYQSDLRAGLKTTVCFLGYKNSEVLLKYLSLFYPLILLPVFFTPLDGNQGFIIFQEYTLLALLFLILTIVFLFFFLSKKNYRLIDAQAYRIMDGYTILSYLIILFATLSYSQ